jgi:DNA repair protein RadA/Sms
MAKPRTRFVCQECGKQSLRYMGRCPACGEFNSMVEEVIEVSRPAGRGGMQQRAVLPSSVPQRLSEVDVDEGQRITVPMEEFNRVLGGGLVPGSITLIGGEPGIGKCCDKNTRIFDPTTGAYLPITEWEKQYRPVLAVDEQELTLSPAPTAAFFKQGVRPIVELKTALGRTLRCTPSHPVLTPDGWQPVGELPSGAYIAAPRALPYFGQDALPEAEIKLIAYILSDGSAVDSINVTAALLEVAEDLQTIADGLDMTLKVYDKKNNLAKQYRFTNGRTERMAARQHVAEALYRTKKQVGISWADWARQANVSYGSLNSWRRGKGVPSEHKLNTLASVINRPVSELMPESRDKAEMTTPAARILDKAGLRTSRAADKAVPEAIFRLPRHQMSLFLKTLFSCDGSVYINGQGQPGISYSTISHRLAEDVQHLLLRYGLIATLRTKPMRVNNAPYTAYEITLLGIGQVQRFLTEIGIMGRHEACEKIMAMMPPALPSTQRDVIPTGKGFWTHIYDVCGRNFGEISRRIGTTVKDRRHERPLTRQIVQKLASAYEDTRLQALAYGDVYWDEIVSVTPAGEEEVYDISVPVKANFVANDLIIHNSTLLAQTSAMLAQTAGRVLYASGEESARQIKMRADRLKLQAEDLFLLTETNLKNILEHVYTIDPAVLIIDSIQTMYSEESESSPGSVSQVRECASRLQMLAKTSGVSVFLVGHVTKEGNIAGPRVLEHLVDTVLYLEGDPFQAYRLLRSVKNRFGATSEVGVFEMTGGGMIEVPNPSEAFLAERALNAPGTAIAVTMEGTRPLLVEIQALTSLTTFGNPRRTPNGIDYNRLLLVSAVLGKRLGLKLHEHDLFVNVVAGMKVDEPASDLAMAVSIASSYFNQAIPADMAFVGEVGLTGELRTVSQLPARLTEAAKLGFKRVMIPKMRRRVEDLPAGLKLVEVRNIGEALAVAIPKD